MLCRFQTEASTAEPLSGIFLALSTTRMAAPAEPCNNSFYTECAPTRPCHHNYFQTDRHANVRCV